MDRIDQDDIASRKHLKEPLMKAILALLFSLLLLTGCSGTDAPTSTESNGSPSSSYGNIESTLSSDPLDPIETVSAAENPVDLASVPDFDGNFYIDLNGGTPSFTADELAIDEAMEVYGGLDSYGRATGAFAKLCSNTQPVPGSKRAKNMPDPSGWKQAHYPEISLDHLYERSHLIAYSLSDEAVNPRDLITGTEQLNQHTMQIFERQIRDYLDSGSSHSKHVLMRVTPDFRGSELVARGVQIEAYSLEDEGTSVCFNVYCYNVQPKIEIDYATGRSWLVTNIEDSTSGAAGAASSATEAVERAYVLNTNTHKFHYGSCSSVKDIKAKNRKDETTTRESLIDRGYKPCARCAP